MGRAASLMDVKGKRVLVVGLGKSGVASAIFLEKHGARVTVSDARTEEELPQDIPQLLDHGISVETGQHGERTFRDQDLIVISPGVPFDVPQLVQARALGIPVIGEVELAARFLKGNIVAITGSNGKTTTTALGGARCWLEETSERPRSILSRFRTMTPGSCWRSAAFSWKP